jgi:methionyl-tRNA formyltransferase
MLKIVEAVPLEKGSAEIGKVAAIASGETGLGIGTGQGWLGIIKLQLAGKKVMTAAEFLRGQRDFAGSVLPG